MQQFNFTLFFPTTQPRANEAGGLYGKGIIVRKYEKDSVMKVRVELTANHMGYFEFRYNFKINITLKSQLLFVICKLLDNIQNVQEYKNSFGNNINK